MSTNNFSLNKNEILKNFIENPHELGYLIKKNKLTELHSYWIKYLWYPKEYFYENNNAEKMINFFNSLGQCFEIEDEETEQLKRASLTEEIFFQLIDNPKRSLQAHRGSYKTTAISTIGCLIRLIFEPDIRICLVQKNFTKASLLLQTIRQAMLIPEIKELYKIAHGFYPKAVIKRDNILTFNFKKTNTPEGNINAYGVTQDMTGKHFDFIQADDFVTLDDKVSKAEREKTIIRLEDILNNILDPGKQMALSGTPWHKEDAWTICPSTLKFDIHMLDILTEEEKKEKKKSLSPVSYAANHELRHIASDETLFKDPKYSKWLLYVNNGIGSLDKKYFGEDTNAIAFAAKKPDGRYQVIGKMWPDHIKNHYDDIYRLWKKYKIGKIYTENNDDKDESTAERLMNKGIMKVESYSENLNKQVKIQDYLLENGFWDLIDFDHDTDKEFINQVIDYTGDSKEKDDCVEVLANLGRLLIGKKKERKYTNMYRIMAGKEAK